MAKQETLQPKLELEAIRIAIVEAFHYEYVRDTTYQLSPDDQKKAIVYEFITTSNPQDIRTTDRPIMPEIYNKYVIIIRPVEQKKFKWEIEFNDYKTTDLVFSEFQTKEELDDILANIKNIVYVDRRRAEQ